MLDCWSRRKLLSASFGFVVFVVCSVRDVKCLGLPAILLQAMVRVKLPSWVSSTLAKGSFQNGVTQFEMPLGLSEKGGHGDPRDAQYGL